MPDKITLEVDQDGLTGKLQLSINERDEKGTGWGYRLHGPKFNGSGKLLLEHVLTQEDANEIRKRLGTAFPQPVVEVGQSPAEQERDKALAERDQARSIAILMRRWAGTPATKALVDRNLKLDQVPLWLIDDGEG